MSLSVSIRHRLGGFALDAAFEAGPGVTALFGRSGAGKTTIAHAVCGLVRPEAGRIALGGRVLVDAGRRIFVPPHRRRIGAVFQDARLFPHLSVRRNLRYGAWLAGGTDPRAEARIVELLGIGALLDRRPGTLSGGERQRVAIGRALLSRPAALVMDEPLAALDAARREEILPYLERLRDEAGLPILYVSHSVAEVARLSDTVVLIAEGRVAATGSPGALMADPGLFPAFGRHEAGVILAGRVEAHDPATDLSRVRTGGAVFIVPGRLGEAGAAVRLRIRARDVMLADRVPQGLSALNVVAVTVDRLGPLSGGVRDIALRAGPDRLLARITEASVARLGVAPGREMHAVLKSISFGRRDLIG